MLIRGGCRESDDMEVKTRLNSIGLEGLHTTS